MLAVFDDFTEAFDYINWDLFLKQLAIYVMR